ncbi:MAG: caspase family protein [Bryobacteraceae bacterium]|nr:caspase family protein [Bryobacteraceae bacterium]
MFVFSCVLSVAPLFSSPVSTQQHFETELVPQMGHTSSVTSVAFSPDGRLALSTGFDDTLRVWEVATGTELRRFGAHTDHIESMALSPDGNLALSGSRDKTLKLWDLATGQELRSFSGHTESVNSVAFSPDGRFALSGSADETLKLWDVATGQELRSFSGHTESVNSVAFSPDGRFALSGSCDEKRAKVSQLCIRGSMTLWEVTTGEKLRSFIGHTDTVTWVTFSPDGRFAFSLSGRNTLKVWEVATGEEIRGLKVHTGQANSVALSADGGFVLSGGFDGTLELWDVAAGKELRSFSGRAAYIQSVAFSPNGRFALSGGHNITLKLWEVATGTELRRFSGPAHRVSSVAFSPDGDLALSGGHDSTLKLWEVATGKELRGFVGHARSVHSVAFSPDGRFAVSGGGFGNRGELKLWEVATGKELHDFSGSTTNVRSVTVSPDGRLALSGGCEKESHECKSGAITLWEVASGKALRNFSGHTHDVKSVAFSPDGLLALSASFDGTLRLWEVATGMELRRFSGHAGPVFSVAFSPDGRVAVSGGEDKTLKLWEVPTGRALRSFSGHTTVVTSVAFSPDGHFALSGSGDGTTRIWDVGKGQELARMIATLNGEWLTMTPEGFFAASPKGAELLNVVRGPEIYSVLQFRDHLYRPDLIEELLKRDPWGKYADAASKLNLETILNSGPAPKLEVLEKRTEKSEDSVKLAVRIRDSGGGIGGKVVWRVDGKTQGDLTTLGLQGLPSPGRAVVMSQTLKVDPGKSNRVEATAYNGQGLLASLPLRITVDPFGVTTTERPKLHVLAAGVDKYAMKDLELRYAVKDATAFAEAMQSVGSTLYSEVKITLLHDREVTKSGLEAAVNKLAAAVKPIDVFVLFVSGHGRSIAGKYYFLQQDLDFTKGQSIETSAVSQDLWQEWLAKIPAQKTLLIYDTCESAAAVGLVRGGERERETAMEQLQHATGHNLIAAARQAAFEGYKGHGVLTYAMLDAFQKLEAGGAEVQKVDVDGLAGHVGNKVPEITKLVFGQRQEPLRKLAGNNFPLGLKILASPAAPVAKCQVPEQQGEPSHIIAGSVRPRTKPSHDAATEQELHENTLVTIKACEGGWALIVKRGKELGYVPITEMKQVY